MKILFLIAFLFVSTAIWGQPANDSIVFAAHKLGVPADSKVEGETKVRGDNYTLEWNYGDRIKVRRLEHAFLDMVDMMTQSKVKRTNLYLLDTKVKGYKVINKKATGNAHQISASGVVNGEAVWVLLTLDREPVTNSDLPAFVQQIIRFEN